MMNFPHMSWMNMIIRPFLLLAITFVGSIRLAQAEDKLAFNPGNYTGTDDILQSASSSVDKLIVLEDELGMKPEDWRRYYRGNKGLEFKMSDISSDARRCILLGAKSADAVLALKARDAETINECAEYIEALAGELGVPDENLDRGFKIKDAVNRGDWMDAFMQLGLLRQDIIRSLKAAKGNDRSHAILIICGAWFHGSSIGIQVIDDHYDPVRTNYLRGPLYVSLMIDAVRSIEREDLKDSYEVKYLLESLPIILNIVDISRDWNVPEGQISRENLSRLQGLATGLTATALTGSPIPVN